MENIWIVHADANRAKGTMTVEEFVALCKEVVIHQAFMTLGCVLICSHLEEPFC
jgi:hypothetical protein